MSRTLSIIAVTTILILASIVRADPAPVKVSVAVVPFQVLAPAGSEWLGHAMQEGLATGINGTPGLSGIIVAEPAPVDATAAIDAAKPIGAGYVIFGAIQLQDGQMRVTGQIISLATRQSVGWLQSDGTQQDLFNIEDILSARCQRILAPARTRPGATVATPRPTIELIGPMIASGSSRYFDGNLMAEISPPADRYREDYNRYYYHSADTSWWGWYGGYPFWGWGWGGWGWGGWGWGGRLVYPVAMPISTW